MPPKLECCKFSLGVWFCLVECEDCAGLLQSRQQFNENDIKQANVRIFLEQIRPICAFHEMPVP